MQMNMIEQAILAAVHELPKQKQQEVLDFSLFIKNNITNQIDESASSSFRSVFRRFLKEVEQEPIDIDTAIFDGERETESGI